MNKEHNKIQKTFADCFVIVNKHDDSLLVGLDDLIFYSEEEAENHSLNMKTDCKVIKLSDYIDNIKASRYSDGYDDGYDEGTDY